MATTPPAQSASQAVIVTGGKQYLVTPGAVIKVEKLDTPIGETIRFAELAFAQTSDGLVKTADLQNIEVSGEVIEQGKGKKLRVFTYKSKKRVRRTLGHRQLFTTVRITAIAPVKKERA